MARVRRCGFARSFFVLLALVASLGASVSDAAQPGDPRNDPRLRISRHERAPNELLVKLDERKAVRHGEAAIRAVGAREVVSFKRPRKLASAPIDHWRLLKFGAGVDIEKVRTRLLKNPNIELVEYNYKVSIDLTPNDPMYPQLWGLNNGGQTGGKVDADIDAPEAWDSETGSQDVVVAVIDTGVDYNHPDLSANIWTNPGEIPGNGIDDDGNGFVDDVHGYDFANNDGDPMDDHGHGTHVSGTIAAVGNNGIGVVGVSWRARIMGVKFLGADGSGFTDGAVNAVLYAASMGAKVMNNSWGGGGFSQALNDAIATADLAGSLFVAAAGNSGSNNDVTPNYPSNYAVPNVLAVAATDRNDAKAGFSSYGAATVDLGAPGVDILSTVPTFGNFCCSDPSGYRLLSGTSMATPHVSGAAALVFARFPGITHHQVKDRLMTSAEPVASLQGITVTGGRLNVAAAFENDAVPPAAVTDLVVLSSTAFSVTLRWSGTGDDGNAGSATSYDLRYSTAPIDETNFNAATPAGSIPASGPAGTLESFTVQDLNPSTLYFFALKARDNVGNLSPLSNPADAMTGNAGIVFSDNFESGAANWTVEGSNGAGGPALWHLSTHRSASPTTAFYYGQAATLNYNTGARNFGSITSGPINLAGATGSALTFKYFLATENLSPFDTARVQVSSDNGFTWTDVFVTASSTGGMLKKTISLTAYDGQTIRVRFSFDTVDSVLNNFEGWVVDDVMVIASTTQADTVPPAAVSNLAVQAVSSGSVTLRWTAPGDDGMTGSAMAYDLRYSTLPLDEGNFAGGTPVLNPVKPAPAGTVQTFVVQGLASGIQYYFALKSIDDAGNVSLLSNVVSAAAGTITVPFDDNFESGAANWTVTGSDGVGGPALWHLSTHRSASPSTAFYYGIESTLNYATGARNFGSITSREIDLRFVAKSRLTFNHFLATENLSPFDTARVQVSADNGLTWSDLFVSAIGTGGAMIKHEFDLSAYDGKLIRLRFSFDTVDSAFNNFEGWVVDNVRVESAQPPPAPPAPPAPPVAHPGGPYKGAVGVPIQFNGSGSSDPNGDPLTYLWDFGDGTSGTGVAPVHAYAAKGIYTVALFVTDGVSTSIATTTATIVNQAPVANPGGPYKAQKNVAVTLNGNGSSDPDGDLLSYAWEFGDGAKGTGAIVSHVYTAAGDFKVTLTVSDGQLSSTATTVVTVFNTMPLANAGGPYSGQKKKPILFDGTKSSDADGDPLTYSWEFGDGSLGSGPTPSHAYALGGTYTVRLFVNDGFVNSLAAFASVTVTNTAPVASLTGPSTVNRQEPASFSGSGSSDADGDSLTYAWDFGDGTTGTGPTPVHVYAAAGTYTVKLVVNDGEVDSAVATTTVSVVNTPPVANAGGPYSGQKNKPILFNGTGSSDLNKDPLTYRWEFGDGSLGTGPTPSHTYARGGTYTVRLIVNDGFVDSLAATTSVTVTNAPPVASLTGPFTVNKQESVSFNGSASSDADGDALTFNWTFGDGGVASNGGPTPAHAYLAAGTFTVTLVVSDGETSSAAATTTVSVLNRPPLANAGPDQTVTQRSTVFMNGSASADPDGFITQFAWRQVSGTAVTLTGAATAGPRFQAPNVRGSTPLQLVFEVRVTDNDGATAVDQVVITVDK